MWTYVLSHLIFLISLKGGYDYRYPNFIDGEAERKGEETSCPKSLNLKVG